MKIKKNFLLSVVTVIMLSLQLLNPITVFADGETTPPPDETTEVTSTPDPTEETEVPEAVSTPLPPEPTADPVETETPFPPADLTELPTETSEPTVDPLETEAPLLPEDQTEPVEESATAEEVVEEPTVAEILAEIPEGTDLVVLDANGEPEPLATQEAAEIIEAGDPIWCPDGILPGGAGCTPAYDTVSALISELQTYNSFDYSYKYSGSGTVYFTSTYSTDVVTFSSGGLYNLTDLTIQGGWNGKLGTEFALSGNTTFTVPVSITNWDNGNVIINNITFNNSSGTGLSISASGLPMNVTVNDSEFVGNSVGVEAIASGSMGYLGQLKLTIQDSEFRENGIGIKAIANSHNDPSTYTDIGEMYLTLNCVQFTNNSQNISQTGSGYITVVDNPCPPPPLPDRDGDGIADKDDACPDAPGIETNNPLTNGCPLLPIILVDGKSVSFSIDCSLFSGYIAAWPNGDRVLISCVSNGTVTIDRVENTNLPDDLDAGYQYASGFNVQVFQNGAPLSVMPQGGSIQVSFVADEDDGQYDIMYWNEDNWKLLEEFQLNPNGTSAQFSLGTQDLRTILKGAQFTSGNPNRENVTTNFMGTYILVVQE